MGFIRPFALLGTLAGLALGQDCPILGPTYPEVLNPSSSTVFAAAKASFDDEITKALASGQLDNGTAFSIQVFSRNSDKLLFERHHGSSVGPDTLYRIGSISKVMTVYTTLAELGDKYWTEPVTKYVPELARLKVRDPVYDTDWSEVTLGALASYLSGIARDYALGDIAPYLPPGIPGIPALNATEQIQCGTSGLRACTRAESLTKIAHTYPISPTHHTPAYSNMAFQLLAYAVEQITHKKFPTLVNTRLLTPLNLTHTFLTKPSNPSNALVLDGWDLDFGEESPAGGYYSTPADLTVLARSILRSTLLPPALTRSWLQPLSHTANMALSLGRPWEIPRLTLTPGAAPVDVYTKQGAVGAYLALLALSPAQGVGYTMLTAGGKSPATYAWLQEKVDAIFLGAAEAAAREEAGRRFAGNYTVEAGAEGTAAAVEVPILRKTFMRSDGKGKCKL
ncbi:beta-lactamase/transpeptidase-like protein [Staphylotrichum tortipilum]|uniref:Beta-lactamase/transpeptidase-like protein n=1 Tax=Staphylotrichum tortipilum TaxID=2831512 RepID=A0AAN6RNJ6_9PEZI|nr:beta-lactamase/transpeptidase-like protein [Staphylotrichum longicolle]